MESSIDAVVSLFLTDKLEKKTYYFIRKDTMLTKKMQNLSIGPCTNIVVRCCFWIWLISEQPIVCRQGGDIELFITPVQKKIYNDWLKNFGDFYPVRISCFIKLSVRTFQQLISVQKREILYIIIWDVHQFIGHCLIPLNPCLIYHTLGSLHSWSENGLLV